MINRNPRISPEMFHAMNTCPDVQRMVVQSGIGGIMTNSTMATRAAMEAHSGTPEARNHNVPYPKR
jgi:hypothetical protein